MSTGAWIFATTALVLAVGAPVSYAAVTSTVAIGNRTNNATATVTGQHQLLTTTIAPKDVVRVARGAVGNACAVVYTPPAGKAIVVTSVTYEIAGFTSGDRRHAYLEDICSGMTYDAVETDQTHITEAHTFPIGLPMSAVAIDYNGDGIANAFITGYLIPASQMPAA
jgi:hypothetical protein